MRNWRQPLFDDRQPANIMVSPVQIFNACAYTRSAPVGGVVHFHVTGKGIVMHKMIYNKKDKLRS